MALGTPSALATFAGWALAGFGIGNMVQSNSIAEVLKGSFDRYLKSDQHKRGTTTVDAEFLKSLDEWRTYLATLA